MARAGIRGIVFGLAAAGFLMGCVEGGGAGGEGPGVAASPAKKKSGAQDVEAPDVFETTDSALWDGRPSLGGIWVAAPEVTNPERAIMFNPATGKSVTGALFKRERENPGPRLQLSSDAAEALGILAGQPTEIRVTALRKAAEVEETPADETAAADPAAETAAKTAAKTSEGEAEPAKDGDAAAIAAAALTAVDAKKPEAAPDATADADPAAVAATAAGAAAVAADGAAAVVDEKPKRKTWKERRAEAKAAREAKKQAAAEAKAAASAAEADAALAAGEAPTATAESAAVAPIQSAPLDARKPALDAAPKVAASEAEPAKPKRNTVGQTQTQTPAPVAEAPAAAEAPVVAAGPVRPIQVASFSKEDNANRAAEALAKIGITAKPQKSEKGGKAVWGVIVQGDEAMLKKIKDAGFADAYFLK
jgi:SPOR domain